MNPDFNCLSIGYSQFIRRSLQSSWYKQVPTHCLSLFATSAEDLPDSVIFSFTMNYTKTTWFLQSTFINILHINPRVFHGSSRRTPCGRTPLTESGLAAFPHPALCETNRSHLPLLWNHRQYRKNNSISIPRNEKFILLSKSEESKEKLQLGRISEYDR